MKPTIGKRAENNLHLAEKPPSAARQFVEINTHNNITLKSDFMYTEDVKIAININTLEERITLKRWLIKQLEGNTSKENLIQELSNIAEKERHLLQKRFKVSK